jgi:hypothetical protein
VIVPAVAALEAGNSASRGLLATLPHPLSPAASTIVQALRYGKIAGLLGSAIVFAAVHGPNLAAVTAVIVGVINAELFRCSRSIWPGVVVHAVNNLLGTGIGILIQAIS